MASTDPPNALDRASFWCEEWKYGDDRGELEPFTEEEIITKLGTLLEASGHGDEMTPDEFNAALDWYAGNFSRMLGLPLVTCKTLFVDGLAHGIAFAAHLEGARRDPR